jgi:hypothetical protein
MSLNIPNASEIITLHSTKKQERIAEDSNIEAQTGSNIFDDILAEICNQIVQDLLEKANNEDEIPSISLDVSFRFRKLYSRALENLGLSNEYSALSDRDIYKKLSSINVDYEINQKFKLYLMDTHNISFGWLSSSATDYADKTGYYKVYDSELSTLNANRQTFELLLIDCIEDKFVEKGYIVNNTISLVRNGGAQTLAEYGGLLTISIS